MQCVARYQDCRAAGTRHVLCGDKRGSLAVEWPTVMTAGCTRRKRALVNGYDLCRRAERLAGGKEYDDRDEDRSSVAPHPADPPRGAGSRAHEPRGWTSQ